jgi:transposase
MHDFRLTSRQRLRLRKMVKSSDDARVVQRAVGLLELDRGAPVGDVATTLGVTRQTLYNWVARFVAEGGPAALRDRQRRGRPSVWTKPVRQFLAWSLDQRPDTLGYAATTWTVPLMREHLAIWMKLRVSDDTLRRELHRQCYAWKRPRYVLDPDRDREKKTQDSAANQTTSGTERSVGRRRNGRTALPAAEGGMGPARQAGRGSAQRPKCAPGDLRRHQSTNWPPRAAAPPVRPSAGLLRVPQGATPQVWRSPLALVLDEDPSHIAQLSRRLAARLNIRLLWLPHRSPELNPMDHLWRSAKDKVSANLQYPSIEAHASRFIRYVRRLSPRAALRKAGVLSRRFWLRGALSKFFCGPT